MNKPQLRPLLLLIPGLVGIVIALITALGLVPRVRLVEAITVFGTAVGGGAAMAAGVLEFRKARAAALRLAPSARTRS
jgi:hypothetical protein